MRQYLEVRCHLCAIAVGLQSACMASRRKSYTLDFKRRVVSSLTLNEGNVSATATGKKFRQMPLTKQESLLNAQNGCSHISACAYIGMNALIFGESRFSRISTCAFMCGNTVIK